MKVQIKKFLVEFVDLREYICGSQFKKLSVYNIQDNLSLLDSGFKRLRVTIRNPNSTKFLSST